MDSEEVGQGHVTSEIAESAVLSPLSFVCKSFDSWFSSFVRPLANLAALLERSGSF